MNVNLYAQTTLSQEKFVDGTNYAFGIIATIDAIITIYQGTFFSLFLYTIIPITGFYFVLYGVFKSKSKFTKRWLHFSIILTVSQYLRDKIELFQKMKKELGSFCDYERNAIASEFDKFHKNFESLIEVTISKIRSKKQLQKILKKLNENVEDFREQIEIQDEILVLFRAIMQETAVRDNYTTKINDIEGYLNIIKTKFFKDKST